MNEEEVNLERKEILASDYVTESEDENEIKKL